MLSILCWKWKSSPSAREQFTSKDVNILYAMLKRNLTIPFKLFCITDDDTGIRKEIEPFPLWNVPDVKNWPAKKPNCFRRLRMYSKEAKGWFGDTIFSIDLDVVILKNIDDIVSREEEFIAWTKGGTRYQGAMILHKTGTRVQLWEAFHPVKVPQMIRDKKLVGSDQAWVSFKLPKNETVWTPEKDGIYSYKFHIRNKPLPQNAKIILFHGTPKASQINDKWCRENWKL